MEPIEEQVFWAVYAASPRWQAALGMDVCLQLKLLHSTDGLFRVLVQRKKGEPLVFAWPLAWTSWPLEEIPRLVADLELERDKLTLLRAQQDTTLQSFETARAKVAFLIELKEWLVPRTSAPALFGAAEADLKQAQSQCDWCMLEVEKLSQEISRMQKYLTPVCYPRAVNPALDAAVADLEGLWQK